VLVGATLEKELLAEYHAEDVGGAAGRVEPDAETPPAVAPP